MPIKPRTSSRLYSSDDLQIVFEEDEEEIIEVKETVKTNQSLPNQQRTLRNIRLRAKTFMEEQSVNMLYLTFGFLH